MDNFKNTKPQVCTPSNVQNNEADISLENLSLVEGAPRSPANDNKMECEDTPVQTQGASTVATEEMEITLSQTSAGGESISSEQERRLLEPQQEPPEAPIVTAPPRVKLCGAGRKRLKAMLAKGIPLETARSLAVKPLSCSSSAIQAASKRCRSDSNTPPSACKQTKRFAPQGTTTARHNTNSVHSPAAVENLASPALPASERMEGVETSSVGTTGPGKVGTEIVSQGSGVKEGVNQVPPLAPTLAEANSSCAGTGAVSKGDTEAGVLQGVPSSVPTLAETVRSIKIGILPPDFPEVIWTTEQITAVQKSILDRVFEGRTGPVKPHFAGHKFMPGWLKINCLDNETVAWLRSEVPALQPWEGAALKVVDEADVPRSKIFVGYFPSSASWQDDRILGQIEAQNADLRVSEWRVLNRLQKGDLVELAVALDPLSADTVEKLGYKVFYGFGWALFRQRHRGNRTKDASNPEDPVKTIAAPAKTLQLKTTVGNLPKVIAAHTGPITDDGPSTSAAAAARLAHRQKGSSTSTAVKPTIAKKGYTHAPKPKFTASGRLRKWERKDPNAIEALRKTKGDKDQRDRKRN